MLGEGGRPPFDARLYPHLRPDRWMLHKFKSSNLFIDDAVAMSSANELVGAGFASRYSLQPRVGFKGPMGRCLATTPSSLSLTSNRVTINLLTFCPRQTVQLITGVCANDRRVL